MARPFKDVPKSLSLGMQWFLGRYTQQFNQRHRLSAQESFAKADDESERFLSEGVVAQLQRDGVRRSWEQARLEWRRRESPFVRFGSCKLCKQPLPVAVLCVDSEFGVRIARLAGQRGLGGG